LATKDRRRQENVATKRDCPRFPSSFLDRIYKIYRILGELEKIVGLPAIALAKAGEWNG